MVTTEHADALRVFLVAAAFSSAMEAIQRVTRWARELEAKPDSVPARELGAELLALWGELSGETTRLSGVYVGTCQACEAEPSLEHDAAAQEMTAACRAARLRVERAVAREKPGKLQLPN